MSTNDIIKGLTAYEEGLCRDINFETPSCDGATRLLAFLEFNFPTVFAEDIEGNPLPQPYSKNLISNLSVEKGNLLVFREGAGPFENFQLPSLSCRLHRAKNRC